MKILKIILLIGMVGMMPMLLGGKGKKKKRGAQATQQTAQQAQAAQAAQAALLQSSSSQKEVPKLPLTPPTPSPISKLEPAQIAAIVSANNSYIGKILDSGAVALRAFNQYMSIPSVLNYVGATSLNDTFNRMPNEAQMLFGLIRSLFTSHLIDSYLPSYISLPYKFVTSLSNDSAFASQDAQIQGLSQEDVVKNISIVNRNRMVALLAALLQMQQHRWIGYIPYIHRSPMLQTVFGIAVPSLVDYALSQKIVEKKQVETEKK